MGARLRPEEAIGADLLDLVRRCQGRDLDAWRAFLAPFQEIGRRALRSFRLPPADSDDILADAHRALRLMLHTHWSVEAWAQARVEFKKALAC